MDCNQYVKEQAACVGDSCNRRPICSGWLVGQVKHIWLREGIDLKKGEFSKAIVALVIALNVIFSASVLYVYLRVGSEPTSLVVAWFAFTTGELWLVAGIRRKKIDRGDVDV